VRFSAVLAALAFAAGCTDDTSSSGGYEGITHVESYWLPAMTAPKLDMLFVLDDTTAMQSHQQPLAALPAQIEQVISATYDSAANYHFGVITTNATNGNLRRSDAVNGSYILFDNNTFGGTTINYQGTLASALASLWPSSSASTASNQPLEVTRAALGGNAANVGFLREDAYLGIVTITASDDASLAAISDYVAFLKATKPDPTRVIVSGVTPPSAARLTTFHAQFPNRNEVLSIDATDYSTALTIFTQIYRTTLGYACNKEPADVDPDQPGGQYDCSFVSVSTIDGRTEHLLPPCNGVVTGPCWEIVTADATFCVSPGERAHLQTRGFTTSPSAYGDPFHPEVRGQCIVN
jgi:hypothetical protein